ncbi:lysozyme inhibitor LprI family protein [Limobrevibacterium gyesilva]|uniref:Lysozyme inhibitor LprI family protein n=1 Tax=Limobrevibacterium gyesilva TaxID=2991712 RepID=A0AA41YRC3_9PROT|nr:lysozyme inhibitor LprI family protein [Limobrevibacterium gyesilva]MCW3475090.1 lysozyme inhibitor LprI family protein [Limobrevibacterium gyesilva]
MLGVLAIVMFQMVAGHSFAAGFDCTRAVTPMEKRICASLALSDADSDLAAAYAAAMAVAVNAQSLRREQARWLAQELGRADTDAFLLQAIQARSASLRAMAARIRAIRTPILRADADSMCVRLDDDLPGVCKVQDSGSVAGAPGPALVYQLQVYDDAGRRSGAAVVVLAATGTDQVVPVVWAQGGSTQFGAPGIVTNPAGPFLLLPGHSLGTGDYSAEALYAWRDGTWREVDIESWVEALGQRLPKGLGAWKGIYPDWLSMTARTDLWQDQDANCCPTGGSAEIALRLNGLRVAIAGLRVTREMPH